MLRVDLAVRVVFRATDTTVQLDPVRLVGGALARPRIRVELIVPHVFAGVAGVLSTVEIHVKRGEDTKWGVGWVGKSVHWIATQRVQKGL